MYPCCLCHCKIAAHARRFAELASQARQVDVTVLTVIVVVLTWPGEVCNLSEVQLHGSDLVGSVKPAAFRTKRPLLGAIGAGSGNVVIYCIGPEAACSAKFCPHFPNVFATFSWR